ncbi:MAG TPA: YifB family Mg chelatase-like AAA ATPase, partial [Syntrophomonadaceae bacterium]|nr:YifB family Mg chelatase-like AAA ATPase [Syntrophomonadaceae bacterium]
LAIAVGILIASGQLEPIPVNYYLAGELSLDGTVRKVPGILPMALELASESEAVFIVPEENGKESALVREITSYIVSNLADLHCCLSGQARLQPADPLDLSHNYSTGTMPDFSEVKGQDMAKRALQIAAAGLHNALLIGPPGGGKTMLARRVPGILPEMTREEILETSRIYSVAGLLDSNSPLIVNRPFRAPHKNASSASIIGGGKIPRPGEISMAQNGVLFMDELPEFSRDVLEALRQPLEDKIVTVARAQATCTFPANFSLIASMNPCPCGNFGSETVECRCSPIQIHNYLSRVSGPLLDRMDLHVEVPRIKFEHLKDDSTTESSASIREKVKNARRIQAKRFERCKFKLNSEMRPGDIKKHCRLDEQSERLLKRAFENFNMSARAYDRILKVARTIADLEECQDILIAHLAEAIQYRSLDRKYWNK